MIQRPATAGCTLLLVLLLVSTAFPLDPAPAAERPPNIVFLFADDMGYADVACYGAPDTKTPRIDRLASRGVRFTQFYSNGPECTPTRTAFFTGRYQQRVGGLECAIGTGNVGRYDDAIRLAGTHDLGLPAELSVIPKALKKTGYSTACFGKWHLGYERKFLPLEHGFDRFFGVLGGNCDYFTHRELSDLHVLYEASRPVERKGYLTHLLADEAVRFLRERAGKENTPFYLYVPFTTPHFPYQGPEDADVAVTPESFTKGTRARYVEMVEDLDRQVGRIIDALYAGAGDTVVVFASDNGGTKLAYQEPLSGRKGGLFEGGIRVPLIVRWPGHLKPGTVSHQVAITMDLTASFLRLAGAAPPPERPLDGIDILRHVEEGRPDFDRTLFWRARRGERTWRAARSGSLKYISRSDGPKHAEWLFDLARDIGEKHNLIEKEPAEAARLKKLLAGWEEDVRAGRPEPAGRAAASAPDRPNILWITAEDMSANLGCYGDTYARTPHLDGLAARGVRYTRAFATAPVCSPVRSCLITGMYATSLGTPNLRSRFPVPAFVKGFPALLRAAGYYTSNNVKTDYNTSSEPAIISASWDASSKDAHWRGRKPGQPFFSVFNDMTTHQSRTAVWPYEKFQAEVQSRLAPSERHDPDAAPVPPYYPDTPVVRRTMARYYDCISVMDANAGRILAQLEEDGLAENTIVFFYSDHGAGMPRHKRLLLDSGLHVPLLIYFPQKYRHLAPAPPGQTVDRLVSFVDFAPTVLSLAGVPVPAYLEGRAFLGAAAAAQKPRQYVFGARDRVDEAYDCARSIRDENYLYIHTFLPHLSYNQPSTFSDQAEIRREITRLAREGKLTTAAQRHYAGPTRPVEELYDARSDPYQVRNLADSGEHRKILERMRRELKKRILQTRDIGLLPEGEISRRRGRLTPYELAQDDGAYPLERILESASLVRRPGDADAATVARQARLLEDADAGVRFWAAAGLVAAGDAAAPATGPLLGALGDVSAPVRIEAAGALAALGRGAEALPVLQRALGGDDLEAALRAARTLELLGEKARPCLSAMREVFEKARNRPGDPYMFLRFALEPALERLAP